MVNEDRIHFWADVQIASMLNETMDLQVVRGDEVIRLYGLPTEVNSLGYRTLKGVGPDDEGLLYIEVAEVVPGSPAELAGVQTGDRLVSVEDIPVRDGRDFAEVIRNSEGTPVDLTVQRNGDGELVQLTLTPAMDEELGRWRIGIAMQGAFELVHPGPLRQMHYFQGSIFRTLKAFTRPREIGKAAQGVGGPVMILSGMHSQVQFHPMQALWFTALINVNLAIINLLPLIILDGGHIMVALFEWITGKKPYRSLIVGLANAMVVILIALMVLLSFRDVKLLQKLNADPEDEPPTESPAAPAPAD
jgi:regulator of sigma E protease